MAIRSFGDVAVHVVEQWDRLAAGWLIRVAADGGHIAVSGGSTPGRAYELAAELLPNWSRAHVWFCDERVVPPGDEDSNFRLLQETLLTRLETPPQVHWIDGELEPADAAARYDEELRESLSTWRCSGIGADGHTASLFPDAPALAEQERRAIAADPGLEPLVPRVTLTPPVFAVDGAGRLSGDRREEGRGGAQRVRRGAEHGDPGEPDPGSRDDRDPRSRSGRAALT